MRRRHFRTGSAASLTRMRALPAVRPAWGHEHESSLCARAVAHTCVRHVQITMESPATIAPAADAPTSRSHHAGVRKVRNAPECPAALDCPQACLSRCGVFACVCIRSWVGRRLDVTSATTTEQMHSANQCSSCHSKAWRRQQLVSASDASQQEQQPAESSSASMFGRPTGCIDQLTIVERAAILSLHGVGWTGQAIAQELRCSENTVSLWLKR